MQVAADISRVYFDPPVFGQINPVSSTGRRATYLYTEITEICRKLRDAGWDHRAIVVERKLYPNGSLAMFDMANPKQWGFVQQLNQIAAVDRAYVPIKVQWFEGSISEHWPEDLFLIHCSETQSSLDNLFKATLENDPPV
jgi:hypothetical protein